MTPRLRFPLRTIQLFQRGVITKHELINQLFDNLTDGNVLEFFEMCSPEILAWLSERSAELPGDDDTIEWSKLITIASYCGPERTAEEWDRIKLESDRRHRSGLRLFRAEIAKRKSQ